MIHHVWDGCGKQRKAASMNTHIVKAEFAQALLDSRQRVVELEVELAFEKALRTTKTFRDREVEGENTPCQ